MRTSPLLVSVVILGSLSAVAHAGVIPSGVAVFGQTHDDNGLNNQTCGSVTTIIASPNSCTTGSVPMQSVFASANIATGDMLVTGTQGPLGGQMFSFAEIEDVLTFSGAAAGAMGSASLSATGTFSGIDAGHVTIGYTVESLGVLHTVDQITMGSSAEITSMFPLDQGPVELQFAIQMTGLSNYTFNDPITITLPPGVTYTSQSGEFLTEATSVPEPSAAILILTGLAGLGFARRRRRSIG